MDSFSEYQKMARYTSVYPKAGTGEPLALFYAALGLVSEAGEVAGKVKKHIRGDAQLSHEALAAEVGDVLWYCAAIASEIGYDLGCVAESNLAKLLDRKSRDVLRGDGDAR